MLTLNLTSRLIFALVCTVFIVFTISGNSYRVAAQKHAPYTANQARAEKLIKEADKLAQVNTPAAKRRAVAKYEQAVKLFGGNQKQRKVFALNAAAKLCQELGEPQRSHDFWQQSLANVRAIKNRTPEIIEVEGIVLLYIGESYQKKGDRETALQNYRQAFDLTRSYKGYAAAGALNSIILLYFEAKQPARAAEFLGQEIIRAHDAKDTEMEKALTDILAQVKDGTYKK